MGFQPPVPQAYSNWEIRAAVLVSLSMQVVLIFLSPYRKRTKAWPLRFTIWSCYLLADWVADLALGLLLNNMGTFGSESTSSPIIFSLWAPFLLLHLGGPDTITAFAIEDNELWLRHLVGLLFELLSTVIIFGCSLGNNPFIAPFVLMFFVGTVKYVERSYCLYLSSIDGFRTSIFREARPGFDYAKLMEVYSSRQRAGLPAEVFVHEASSSRTRKRGRGIGTDGDIVPKGYEFFERFKILWGESRLLHPMDLFFDLYSSESVATGAESDVSRHVKVTEVELNYIYDVVYTKAKFIHTRAGYISRGLCSIFICASILVFFFLDKQKFERVDVIITYVLLLGAFSLDMASLMMLLGSDWTHAYLAKSKSVSFFAKSKSFSFLKPFIQKLCQLMRPKRWSWKMTQMSLINCCMHKPIREGYIFRLMSKKPLLNFLAKIPVLGDMVDDFLYVKHIEIEPNSKVYEFIYKFFFGVIRSQKNKKISEIVYTVRGTKTIVTIQNC